MESEILRRKSGIFSFFALALILVSLISLVSAQSGQMAYRFASSGYVAPPEGSARDSVNEFFVAVQENGAVRFIIGDFSSGAAGESELFFIKLLVFILLVGLVMYGLKRVPGLGDRRGVVVLLSVVVSLISIRYITTPQLVDFIWLPYGVLGIFLVSALPFLIGFFFIESFPSMMTRKILWSVYVIIFAGLAWMRWSSLEIIGFGATGRWYENLGMIYLLTAVISLLMMLFDKEVRSVVHRAKYAEFKDRANKKAALGKDIEIEELYRQLSRTSNQANINFIQSEIRRAQEARNRISRT